MVNVSVRRPVCNVLFIFCSVPVSYYTRRGARRKGQPRAGSSAHANEMRAVPICVEYAARDDANTVCVRVCVCVVSMRALSRTLMMVMPRCRCRTSYRHVAHSKARAELQIVLMTLCCSEIGHVRPELTTQQGMCDVIRDL